MKKRSKPTTAIKVYLQQWRNLRGMTSTALADTSGISRSYINLIESGQRRINIDNLAAFADALEVSPAYLLRKPTDRRLEIEALLDAIPDERIDLALQVLDCFTTRDTT